MPPKALSDCLFTSFPTLRTPRLLLRVFSLDDAEALLRVFSDPPVSEHQDWSPFSDLSQATDFIADRLQRFQRRVQVNWAMVLKEDGSLIGQLGMHTISARDRRAEIAFDLGSAYWRQQFMTEAVTAVLSFAFDECQLNKVVAQASVENLPCHAFLQSLGFAIEGRLHNHCQWKGRFHDVHVHGLQARYFRRV